MNLKITDVRAHPGDSAFLVDDGVTSVLYDTGFAFTGYAIADNIRKVLGERQLDYIFLTHSHYDHALGSAYICARYPDVKVVAGEYAVKIFAKPVQWTLQLLNCRDIRSAPLAIIWHLKSFCLARRHWGSTMAGKWWCHPIL